MKSVQIRIFFWSVFSYIRTEYRDLLRKSPYSVRIQENADQKKLRIWTLFTQCRPYHLKFFKGCLPQILLGTLLNTLIHLSTLIFILQLMQVTTLLPGTIWGAFPQLMLKQDSPTLTVIPNNSRQHNFGCNLSFIIFSWSNCFLRSDSHKFGVCITCGTDNGWGGSWSVLYYEAI